MPERWNETRREHRARQRIAIAASALDLVAQLGAPGLTMASIAEAAGVSRQTLYRYYDDVDAVLVGVAEFVTTSDDDFARRVRELPDPAAQLDAIVAAATNRDHAHQTPAALVGLLSPTARDILTRHRARACELLGDVLRLGVADGSFDSHVEPRSDAPLILGLLDATDPSEPERAASLVHRLVRPTHQEPST